MAKKKNNDVKQAGKVIPVRCKGSRTVPYDKLKHFQGDLKELSREDFKALKSRILKHGWIAPVFVWNGNQIIDGHGRLLVLGELLKEGYTIGEIPVADIEAKSKKEAAQILLAVNSHYQKITGEGLYHFMSDMELDTSDLEGLSLPDIDVENFMEEFFKEGSGGNTDPDEVPEVPVIPKTKAGDLWLLGEHRLLCGDSTKIENIERLMDGKKADMVFTDPPYGIDIIANSPSLRETKKLGTIGGSVLAKTGKYKPIQNDQSTDVAKQVISLFINKYSNLIVWGGNYFTDILPPSRGWIIWDKKNGDTTFADVELAWTSINKSSRLYSYLWSGMRREGKRNEEGKFRYHPTQKPVGLINDILKDWANNLTNIIDPFLGSGTTLIACEKTDRICFGMEIDPHYCDVILERWANFTGKDPVREDGVKWSELKTERPDTELKEQTFAQA